jgi:hypothetical protein
LCTDRGVDRQVAAIGARLRGGSGRPSGVVAHTGAGDVAS